MSKAIYVPAVKRQPLAELEEMTDKQREAFELLYDIKSNQMNHTQIGAAVGYSREWICKFHKSELYKRAANERNKLNFSELTPLALKTLEDLVVNGSERTRKDIALKIVEQDRALNVVDTVPTTGNILQFFNNVENINHMSIDEIRKVKAQKLKEYEEIEQSSTGTGTEDTGLYRASEAIA